MSDAQSSAPSSVDNGGEGTILTTPQALVRTYLLGSTTTTALAAVGLLMMVLGYMGINEDWRWIGWVVLIVATMIPVGIGHFWPYLFPLMWWYQRKGHGIRCPKSTKSARTQYWIVPKEGSTVSSAAWLKALDALAYVVLILFSVVFGAGSKDKQATDDNQENKKSKKDKKAVKAKADTAGGPRMVSAVYELYTKAGLFFLMVGPVVLITESIPMSSLDQGDLGPWVAWLSWLAIPVGIICVSYGVSYGMYAMATPLSEKQQKKLNKDKSNPVKETPSHA